MPDFDTLTSSEQAVFLDGMRQMAFYVAGGWESYRQHETPAAFQAQAAEIIDEFSSDHRVLRLARPYSPAKITLLLDSAQITVEVLEGRARRRPLKAFEQRLLDLARRSLAAPIHDAA